MTINRLINNIFRNRKRTVKIIKNCKSELPIFEKNVNRMLKTIKYTKSIDTMIKMFDNIKQEFQNVMSYLPPDIELELNGQVIKDINMIDTIRDTYIKDFINERIDMELEKEKIVTSVFLKENLIKRALNRALTAFTYFPEDAEFVCRISELEEMLLNCYNKKEREGL